MECKLLVICGSGACPQRCFEASPFSHRYGGQGKQWSFCLGIQRLCAREGASHVSEKPNLSIGPNIFEAGPYLVAPENVTFVLLNPPPSKKQKGNTKTSCHRTLFMLPSKKLLPPPPLPASPNTPPWLVCYSSPEGCVWALQSSPEKHGNMFRDDLSGPPTTDQHGCALLWCTPQKMDVFSLVSF